MSITATDIHMFADAVNVARTLIYMLRFYARFHACARGAYGGFWESIVDNRLTRAIKRVSRVSAPDAPSRSGAICFPVSRRRIGAASRAAVAARALSRLPTRVGTQVTEFQ